VIALTIYLVCHNRPDDTREAIASILLQTDQSFKLIVSDNSSDERVRILVESEFPNIQYIRRQPITRSLEHFNRCIAEAESDYFCLFHDDDLMTPDYVLEMKKLIQHAPDAIALSCNGRIEKFGQTTDELFFYSASHFTWSKDRRSLARRYFARSQSGIAPFPGYVYNRKLVADERIPVDGGKYADVTWLLNLATLAPIVWIDKALMIYRFHAGNDGSIESRKDRLTFLAYLKSNRSLIGDDILQDYRCSFIYKKIRKEQSFNLRHRNFLANRFLNYYKWARYFRISTYAALIIRGVVKLRGLQ
jgi:GT2 family glycosyltransferase